MWVRLTTRAVEKSTSNLDGVVGRVGGNRVVDLPQAKAHLGHLVAATQLYSEDSLDPS